MDNLPSLVSESLKWRYAVKKFDNNKKISDAHWTTLKQSLVLSPSSYGLQPWRFVLVKNKLMREKLFTFSRNQTQVTDCSHYVVFTYLKNLSSQYIESHISRIAEMRGQTLESLNEYKNRMQESLLNGPRAQHLEAWSQRQCFIAMGFLLQSAALLKIDACPMEGIEPENYDKVLNLEGSDYKTLATVALGYRHKEDKYQHLNKVRFAENKIFTEIL